MRRMAASASQSPLQLDALELQAWKGFLRTHSELVGELSSELDQMHGLPLSSYEVLLYLNDAPGRRLRMSELAASVLLSPSGITRLVDRLVADGLVVKERCRDDRRGFNAVITDAGRERFTAARETHLAGVRARFHERLTQDDLAELARIWDKLRA
jgi:DNA-binding MarR family transcriptional regulator